ncbi:MAG: transketolase [Gammaproteobacteria bacterium]|nr:transketolase [Gammaproteobacteria bacterium]
MPTRRDLANAIRALSMDAVQKAKSGHPGAPMGMADIAEVLWNDFLTHNPANPKWANRDRFILSNGHGSMLIYSLLHLSGYDLSIDDVKAFRQLHSKTPGHPEYGYTPGVETTTGPLGQGLANAVGMAIAEKTLAAQFNRPDLDLVDHYTYVFAGDGCLMEGISHEVCSLAGTLQLGKLIVFYDDNRISIDGEVEGWFTDDTPKRFESYGWQVIPDIDGHDANAVKQAIIEARAISDKPTLICCKTIIGWGSPGKQGTESCHGSPLGETEVEKVRENIGWSHPAFEVPSTIYGAWDARSKGQASESAWNVRFADYQKAFPELAREFERRMSGEAVDGWAEQASAFIAQTNERAEKIATRKASQNALEGLAPLLPELVGGSADLAGSNLTLWSGSKGIHESPDGNYIFYGVREFGMAAIMNGLCLHGGFKPYGGTFLIFSDYARNALRMSALMKLPCTYVLTHDSIGLGEDGPTHQPIEQAASLRLIPGMSVWRPSDAVETAVAWCHALERNDGPTSLLLTRQGLPHVERTEEQMANIARGGYTVVDCDGEPEVILIATGSELELGINAQAELSKRGRRVRLVSMPSTDVFDAQDAAYKASVLLPEVTRRVAIEAGATEGWYKYVGLEGQVLGLDRFGESAPASDLFEYFKITTAGLVGKVESLF